MENFQIQICYKAQGMTLSSSKTSQSEQQTYADSTKRENIKISSWIEISQG